MDITYPQKTGSPMRAMILAAGRGQRMGALTEHTPKPLLKINGRHLIEYSILALAKIKVTEIIINVSYLKNAIQSALGDGKKYGVHIHYSNEEEALETGGGIMKALPLLGDDPFIVLSSDIISDYPLQNLPKQIKTLAHLVLVDNPVFLPNGDFGLRDGLICPEQTPTLTHGNIGVYRRELFEQCSLKKFPLGPILREAAAKKLISGEHFQGIWHNIGTPELLKAAALCPLFSKSTL